MAYTAYTHYRLSTSNQATTEGTQSYGWSQGNLSLGASKYIRIPPNAFAETITSVSKISWIVALLGGNSSPVTYTRLDPILGFCVKSNDGSKILAAADSGGTLVQAQPSTYTGIQNELHYLVSDFAYINQTATNADWEDAYLYYEIIDTSSITDLAGSGLFPEYVWISVLYNDFISAPVTMDFSATLQRTIDSLNACSVVTVPPSAATPWQALTACLSGGTSSDGQITGLVSAEFDLYSATDWMPVQYQFNRDSYPYSLDTFYALVPDYEVRYLNYANDIIGDQFAHGLQGYNFQLDLQNALTSHGDSIIRSGDMFGDRRGAVIGAFAPIGIAVPQMTVTMGNDGFRYQVVTGNPQVYGPPIHFLGPPSIPSEENVPSIGALSSFDPNTLYPISISTAEAVPSLASATTTAVIALEDITPEGFRYDHTQTQPFVTYTGAGGGNIAQKGNIVAVVANNSIEIYERDTGALYNTITISDVTGTTCDTIDGGVVLSDDKVFFNLRLGGDFTRQMAYFSRKPNTSEFTFTDLISYTSTVETSESQRDLSIDVHTNTVVMGNFRGQFRGRTDMFDFDDTGFTSFYFKSFSVDDGWLVEGLSSDSYCFAADGYKGLRVHGHGLFTHTTIGGTGGISICDGPTTILKQYFQSPLSAWDTGNLFGGRVSINDKWIAVGLATASPSGDQFDDQGAVEIFENDYGTTNNFSVSRLILISSADTDPNWGHSVALNRLGNLDLVALTATNVPGCKIYNAATGALVHDLSFGRAFSIWEYGTIQWSETEEDTLYVLGTTDSYQFKFYDYAGVEDQVPSVGAITLSDPYIAIQGTPQAETATTSGIAERVLIATSTSQAEVATSSGAVERVLTADSTAEATIATTIGVGVVNTSDVNVVSGSPQAETATATGLGEFVYTATGTPAAEPASTSSTAVITKVASGSSTVETASSTGEVERVLLAAGSAQTEPATASGISELINTASGTSAAQEASASGLAEVIKLATATAQANLASTSGIAERIITSTGSGQASTAEVNSGAERILDAVGESVSETATSTGVAERTLSGVAVSQADTATTTSAVEVVKTATSVVQAEATNVSGVVEVVKTVVASPQADTSDSTGSATRTVTAIGSPQAETSTSVADVENVVTASGIVSVEPATTTAVVEVVKTITGSPQAELAESAGTGDKTEPQEKFVFLIGAPTASNAEATAIGTRIITITANTYMNPAVTSQARDPKLTLTSNAAYAETSEYVSIQVVSYGLAMDEPQDTITSNTIDYLVTSTIDDNEVVSSKAGA